MAENPLPPVQDQPAPGAQPSLDEVPSMGKEVSRGMLWTSLSSLVARGLGFGNTILLTYWVDKPDYGRASVAYALSDTLGFFSVPGVESEIIRRKERFGDAAVLATLMSSLIMLVLCGGTYLFADRITTAFNAPGAAWYLRLALAIPLFKTTLLVANCILCREMRFGAQSMLEVTGTVANVGSAVGLAATGFGGWSVVAGQVLREGLIRVGGTMLTGLSWLRRPTLDLGLAKAMLAFGIPVYISEVLEHIATNWDNLFVAKVFGAKEAGVYMVAYTIAYTPVYTVAVRSASVVLAAVSRFAEDRQRRHEAVLRALSAIMLVLGPATMMIMLCGWRGVLIVFPDKWTADVGTLVTGLALVGVGLPMQFIPDYYFQAIGKPRATAGLMAMKVALMFTALFIFGRASVEHAAWSVSVSFVVAGLGACALLFVVDRIPLHLVFQQILPGLLGCAAFGGAVYLVRRFIALESNLLMLVLECGLGGAAFLAYELVFHRWRVLDIINTVRGRSGEGEE